MVEGKGKIEYVEGEDSSWRKLMSYVRENDITINSLGIWCGDRHFNLPSISPKFGGSAPLGYNYYRKYCGDVLGSGSDFEHYICVEAIYDDFTVQLWVDEVDTNKSWISIKEHKKWQN